MDSVAGGSDGGWKRDQRSTGRAARDNHSVKMFRENVPFWAATRLARNFFTKRLALHRPERWYGSDRSGLPTVRVGCSEQALLGLNLQSKWHDR